MSFIAILGAGALGGALAHRLAVRDRVGDVRLIDSEARIAQGKALDITQSAPIDGFTTRVSGTDGIEAAAGASVIVFADHAAGDAEHTGETGLATVRRVAALDTSAPLLFAGASQRQLMMRAVTELRLPANRIIGSAPAAVESAVRALVALECDGSGVEIQVRVVGVPPRAAVIAWEEATASGQPVTSMVAPHRLAAISARIPSLWPPGPFVLASAAARVVEAIVNGSRRHLTCFVSLEDAPLRRAVGAMPVKLGKQGIEDVLRPALTRQEQTLLENGLTIS